LKILIKGTTVKENQFEPKILAFICNWCAYSAADLAGVSRLQYPPNLRSVRVMCSATVSPHHILRALQDEADGVLVGG
jgi:F420-non-reducing hydrogenase iron-sulfur subunit